MDRIDSKTQRRQLELMKKRFDVDEENKIVQLNLTFDTADELLEKNIDSKVPTFDRGKFEEITDTISDFPFDYKTDLNIKINDYQDYDSKELVDSLNDAVELNQYSGNKEHRKKWIQITFLLIAGIMILNIMAKGFLDNWLGLEETTASVFREVFDITSWVFIWQAVSLMFLSPTITRRISMTLARRLNKVSLRDKDGNTLQEVDYFDLYQNTINEKKARTFGKYALLISGAAFLALAISNIISVVFSIPDLVAMVQSETEGESIAMLIIVEVIFLTIEVAGALFEALGGVAAMGLFVGKKGKTHKMVLPFGIIVFLLLTTSLVLSIVKVQISFAAIAGEVIALLYLAGAVCLILTRDKAA